MAQTIVSPSGNPEVWPEEKISEKLEQGYRNYDEWLAEQAEIARQKHQEWLTSEDTREERFRMLRAARDAKLSQTDYLLAADYPIDKTLLAQVREYRTALRDLPSLEGAPWDGGGELTPWPAKPEI